MNVKCFPPSAMSEFKFACPVCGQHMRCDTSQAGTVMECPTCFQKITAPQAPADSDQKFILTGSKVKERKIPLPVHAGGPMLPQKKSSVTAIVVVIVMLAVGAGVFFLVGNRSGEKPSNLGPAPAWQSGDIGAVGAAGSLSQANGIFTINGSGADIWHQADGFHFVFQTLRGDGSLSAEILDIQNTEEWAKAGVMIRDTTNASSVFVLASLRADGQSQSIWRRAAGAEAEASALAGGTGFPKWVKIVRDGNSFTAYYKVNAGDAWEQLGSSQTINMGPDTLIGLFVCSHNAGVLCQAQFDQVTLQSENKTSPAAAPLANAATWMLSLGTNAIPDSPAAGRIHGQDFIVERASFHKGSLMLRAGTHGPVEFGLFINFNGAQPDALSGQTINVTTNAEKATHVSLRWKDASGAVQKENYHVGYALRLEFGELANGRLPGKIYLCLPDEAKSYIAGKFTAEIRKPQPSEQP